MNSGTVPVELPDERPVRARRRDQRPEDLGTAGGLLPPADAGSITGQTRPVDGGRFPANTPTATRYLTNDRRKSMSLDLFTPQDSAILLIDHQAGTMSWIRSAPFSDVKANALALAKAAKALDIPLVLTTSLEDHAQGPLLEEFEQIAPGEYAGRIQREGVVNAMDDPAFAAAVASAGRANLIIAGVTNDVCTVYPTLTALDLGHRVQVVADAGGSMSTLADQLAQQRMANAGAGLTSTNMILTELARHWATPAGEKLIPIVGELIPA